MKIRMLVNGHQIQDYALEDGKQILSSLRAQGNFVVDDEAHQLAKIEGLAENSRVTVYPHVSGG
jgi:predicted transcriptional regulator YheO